MDSSQRITPTPSLRPRKGPQPPAALRCPLATWRAAERAAVGGVWSPPAERGVSRVLGEGYSSAHTPSQEEKNRCISAPCGEWALPRVRAEKGDIWEITEDAFNRRQIYHTCLSSVLDFSSQTQEILMVSF